MIGSFKVDSDGSTIKVAGSPDGPVTLWIYRAGLSPVVVEMRPSESQTLESLLHVANS